MDDYEHGLLIGAIGVWIISCLGYALIAFGAGLIIRYVVRSISETEILD